MHGHNAAFIADPLGYLQARTINNLIWFRRAVADRGDLAFLFNTLGQRKWGFFDFEHVSSTTTLFKVVPGPVRLQEAPVRGYWCPFIQGHDKLPGWVDIPKRHPGCHFVFTAAMNGCRLVVTDRSEAEFRVYHHQHPDEKSPARDNVWALIEQQGHRVVDTFGEDEYGLGAAAGFPSSFNFMHYYQDRWYFVSQPQTFDMHKLECKLIPGRAMRRPLPVTGVFSAPLGRSQAQQLAMAMARMTAYEDDDDD